MWVVIRTILSRPSCRIYSSQAHPLLRVQSGGGFIQQQDLGRAQQGLGQHHPLAHAAGKAAYPAVGRVPQVHHLQQLLKLFPGSPGPQPLQLGHVQQEFPGGHVVVHPLALGHEAQHLPERRPHGQNVCPVEGDGPHLAGQQVADQVDEGAFPRAVGAQQGRDAGGEGVGKVRQGFLVPVGMGQGVNGQFHIIRGSLPWGPPAGSAPGGPGGGGRCSG